MAIKPFGSGGSSGGGGGGGSSSLATITGTLNTLKGGTGLNATDLGDLRQKLGIANPSNSSDEYLDYCADTRHQPNNTIQRVDDSTSNAPSDVADGLIIKVGNDQVVINLADGKQWVRTHTTSARTSWNTPVDASLTEIISEAQFRGMQDGAVAYTSQTAWLPQYPDNTRPAKVIIARVGEYLIACARYNMWWSPRPTADTWAEVPWRWEGDSQVPQGLEFSGGVNDEDRIPAGAVAVLGNKENVDQDSAGYILLMTKHTVNNNGNTTTSTYTGYFVDDDSGKTIKRSTSTIGKTTTNWGRVKVDIEGIADTIITADRDSGEPVFHGIIPEISSMGFPGYRFKTGTNGLAKGDISYNASTRTAYVWHKDEDTHLGDLFHEDFEVEIHKDEDNYIKGVFEQVTSGLNLPGSIVLTGALFRSEDLKTEGTISAGDTVEIKGHKSVITKDDTILPVNLGLPHGADEAGKIVRMDSTGDNFELSEPSGLPTGAQIPSTAPTKTSELTVTGNTNPTNNQIRIQDAGGLKVHVSGDDATNLSTMLSNAITRQQWLLIVKDSNNYIGIKPTASTITSGSVSMIHENLISRVQRGTISNNDTVRLWLRPENAGKHIVHDFLGESIIIEPERPHLIYVRQTTGIGSPASGTNWNWIVTTPAWKIPVGFKVGGHIEVKGGGVANFGNGDAEQIVPELMVQHRSGNTLANTSSATWRNLDINNNIDADGIKLLFRSKVSSGGASGADRFRDYWTYASKPMPMREMHSDCVDGNYVQFQLGLRRANSSNPAITSIYGFDMTIHVWPPSLVTAL